MFYGKYKEIHITYDNETLGVEADGLLPDGTWENLLVQFDVDNPESYAYGVYDTFKKLYPTILMTVSPEASVLKEGWHLGDTD